MNKEKKREVVEVEEEKDSEDWCFECKDGGDLIICDYKGCLKVYHPRCVGKKKNFMNSGRHWTCRKELTFIENNLQVFLWTYHLFYFPNAHI